MLGSGAKRGASILDAVTGLARVKTAADLSAKVAQYRESGLPALERLRLVRDINALVAELGGKPQAEAGEPAEVKALRAIAKGAHDGETLLELYVRIQAAINALTEAGALAGDAESVAHDAITRWAELESQDA